jgi:hypothetical protein
MRFPRLPTGVSESELIVTAKVHAAVLWNQREANESRKVIILGPLHVNVLTS